MGQERSVGVPLVSWELKEAERCRISKVHTSPTFNLQFEKHAGVARALLHSCSILGIAILPNPEGAGTIEETNQRVSWIERFYVMGRLQC